MSLLSQQDDPSDLPSDDDDPTFGQPVRPKTFQPGDSVVASEVDGHISDHCCGIFTVIEITDLGLLNLARTDGSGRTLRLHPERCRSVEGVVSEEPLAQALRKAHQVNLVRVGLLERQRRDLDRLGEELRDEQLRRLTAQQDLQEAVGMIKTLREDVSELRLQLKAFQVAGTAVERAVMKTFDKLRAEIEQKEAVIRALVAEGD